MKPVYLVWAYLAIAVLFALFGGVEGRAFSYNLGRGLMWPAVMFPEFGKLLGGLIIVGLVGLFVVFGKK